MRACFALVFLFECNLLFCYFAVCCGPVCLVFCGLFDLLCDLV